MTKRGIMLAMLLPMLLLAACGSDDDDDRIAKIKAGEKPPKKQATVKTEELICPQVAVLRQAQQISDYGHEKPDASQLVAAGRMKEIEGDCAYRDDGVDIAFTLHMAATRGPRLGGGNVDLPYFIAIVDPAENIVKRQSLTAHFEFGGDDRKADLDEPLHVFLPLAKSVVQAGPDYRVLVGFKLPADQMPPQQPAD